MSRAWLWAQLAAAWLPMWALFTALLMIAHDSPLQFAALGAMQLIAAAAILAIAVYRFTLRHPWPYPFRPVFVLWHALAAILYAAGWIAIVSIFQSIALGRLVIAAGPGLGPFLITGVWLYLIVAGVIYSNQAAQRAAQLEANAARTQLAALRAQLHPHFIFNALHAVVQLIPVDPRAASRAAEQLAEALRTTVDEKRDVIALSEEWSFVERYLALESIRHGERLVIENRIEPSSLEALLPSFALQTLVENAVRHGVGPRAQPTRVTIHATAGSGELLVRVMDDGAGCKAAGESAGTGLARLRERLRWLYGDRARLEVEAPAQGGFIASIAVPRDRLE